MKGRCFVLMMNVYYIENEFLCNTIVVLSVLFCEWTCCMNKREKIIFQWWWW